MQADLLRGKSIGFLPTKVHQPKTKELEERGWSNGVDLVIDEWLLLEYACTFLPAQQNAVVEAVSKAHIHIPDEVLKAMGLDPGFLLSNEGSGDRGQGSATPTPNLTRDPSPLAPDFVHTPLEEIEKALCRRIAEMDLSSIAQRAAVKALDKHRGRV